MFTYTSFSRSFVRFVALPLLFIAGVQLFIFPTQTDIYFAWTIALPLTAAFMGAGYWSAMIAGYMSFAQKNSIWVRVVGPTAIAATSVLGIATFLHLDKFHLDSPALLTRFVTWVWIIVYVVAPLSVLGIVLMQERGKDNAMGAHPLPGWVRFGYISQGILVLLAGFVLFIRPAMVISYWPWELTPLTARAISAWLMSYGLACISVFRENDRPNTAGIRGSVLAFCLLQSVVLARYFASVDWMKPFAWIYVLVLLAGVIVSLPGLFSPSK